MIRIQRVYSQSVKGYSILVDRIWPRGIRKSELNADEWMKDIAPSDSLRKWFGHDPEKWQEFRKKYKEELAEKKELLRQIKSLEKEHGEIVFLFAAKDEVHNNAVVLREAVEKQK